MRQIKTYKLEEGNQTISLPRGAVPVALDHDNRGSFLMVAHSNKYRKTEAERKFSVLEIGAHIETPDSLIYIDSINRKGQIYLLFEIY